MLTTTRHHGWLDPARFGKTFSTRAPVDAGVLADLPTHVRLPVPDEVYDQGPIGSCVAQGLALACEIAAKRSGMTPDRPSRRWLYWKARQAIGTTDYDSGSIGGDGLAVLRQGWVSERDYPHAPLEWGEAWTKTPPEAREDAPFVLNSEALPHDVATIVYELAMGHPVVGGFRIDDGWDAPGEFLPAPRGARTGGHFIGIVGYQREGSEVLLRVRNSWSEDTWGDHGEVWMPAAPWISVVHCGELHAVRVTRPARRR